MVAVISALVVLQRNVINLSALTTGVFQAHAVAGQPPKAAQSKRIPSHHLAGSDFTYNLKGLSNNTDYYVVIR